MDMGSNKRIVIFYSLILIIFVTFIIYTLYLGRNSINEGLNLLVKKDQEKQLQNKSQNEVMGIRDDSSGNIRDEQPKETELTDEEQIKKLFSEKYEKNPDEIIVGISKNTGTYAMGGVSFNGEISGGWFLAVKQDSKWELVQDGNGLIICQIIAPYDFPGDMVPECYDADKQTVVARTGPDYTKQEQPDIKDSSDPIESGSVPDYND